MVSALAGKGFRVRVKVFKSTMQGRGDGRRWWTWQRHCAAAVGRGERGLEHHCRTGWSVQRATVRLTSVTCNNAATRHYYCSGCCGRLQRHTIAAVVLSHPLILQPPISISHLASHPVRYLEDIHLTTTWQQFYEADPAAGISDPLLLGRILGGEACMFAQLIYPFFSPFIRALSIVLMLVHVGRMD